ncbi:MAG TPA: hypothetical protein VL943_02140, partial [Niabella sp.]|nr:hypothetical protein [Niabella sp.]
DTTAWQGQAVTSGTVDIVKRTPVGHTGDTLITTVQSMQYATGAGYKQERVDTLIGTTHQVQMGKAIIKDKVLPADLYWKFIGLVFLLILYVTMVYGPIAAFLVELFPIRIRYTSMSLPYHIGNGVFGGLVPFIGVLLQTTFTSDPLVGLWYPIAVAALCFIIGAIYLNNKIDEEVND